VLNLLLLASLPLQGAHCCCCHRQLLWRPLHSSQPLPLLLLLLLLLLQQLEESLWSCQR
jgi:hypothetical protein